MQGQPHTCAWNLRIFQKSSNVWARVHGRSQREMEIVCLVLYLIILVGKMKFQQSDSMIKE